jgi:hypothetical protein
MRNREKEVPSTLEVAALDLKSTYALSREQSLGTVGATTLTLAVTALKPLIGRQLLGPASFKQEAFLNIKSDIMRSLNGKKPFLGDHFLEGEPEEYTKRLLKGVHEGDVDLLMDTRVGKLTQYVMYQLEKKQLPDEDAKRYFGDWLEATIDNHERTKEREIRSTSELEAIYDKEGRETDVQLVLAGTDLRTRRVSDDFRKNLGQLEALKNIIPNWEKGKIDVPREVLEAADLDPVAPVDELKSNQSVFEWKRDTVVDTLKEVRQGVYGLEHDKKHVGTKASKKFLARCAIEIISNDWC